MRVRRRRRGADRARAQAASVGRAIRVARAVAGLSVGRAATIAGVGEATWRRIERGSAGATVSTLCAMAATVGLDLVLQTYAGAEPRLRDSGQLAVAERIRSMAPRSTRISLEVPAGDHGEAIDMVLWGASEIIAVEIERLIVDVQAQLRRVILKRERLASEHRRLVRLVVVVEDTRRNRAALTPHLPVIRTTLPAGTREVMSAIRAGAPLGRDGLAWVRRPAPTSRS
jgi:transcriptional regulator with XRE-family HTH domain